jgi:chromosome segregation ATPase
MAKKQKTLGRQLLDMLEQHQELLINTRDPKRCKELEDQRSALLKKIGALVDANLDAATEEYKEATAAVEEASEKVRNAIQGLESVVKAIEAVSKVVDAVTTLV